MKKSDFVEYETYRDILLDDDENLSEEEIKKSYNEFLESDEFEIIARLFGELLGQSEESIEENLKSVRKM